jgi:hypothetical protein
MQWPVPQFPTQQIYNPRASSTDGFSTIATGSPANTKGSWVTLVSGTTKTGSWVNLISRRGSSFTDTATIMDIAIGGAGSETIVVPDLMIGFRTLKGLTFPLHVPAGATVRARLASAQASAGGATYSLDVYGGEPDVGLSVPGRITAYGTVPASSGGTTITPSATANTKSSWTQLTAATTAPIHALMVLVQGVSDTMTGSYYKVDIAVGGSGSETIVIADHLLQITSVEEMTAYTPEFYPLSLNIPAGVRLAARCSAITASSSALEVAVYGFTY